MLWWLYLTTTHTHTGAQRETQEAQAAGPKYQPSTEDDDPIVQALQKVLGVETVESTYVHIPNSSLSVVEQDRWDIRGAGSIRRVMDTFYIYGTIDWWCHNILLFRLKTRHTSNKKIIHILEKKITEWELLDSRWNGNEVFKYTTDKGLYFIKLNRVEDPSVFLTEAVGLSAIAATETITCPKPLHLGKLPKVGDVGPGAFMILEHLKLLPFGIMRSDMQK